MRFWDSSGLVPLLVRQRASGRMRSLYRSDPGVLAWWGAAVECESAISRLEREGLLRRRPAAAARARLDRFAATWHEVQPSEPLRENARRFLRVHDLRPADALQLAAASAAATRIEVFLPLSAGDVPLTSTVAHAAYPVRR